METLTIRRATLSDLTSVDALFSSSYTRLLSKDYPPSVVVTALPILSRAQPDLLASGRYYVAERSDGVVVGAGGWSWSRQSGPDWCAEVRHLVTDWRMTRRGIAGRIMAQVVAETAQAGASGLSCLATLTAVPFYQAVGFLSLGPVRVTLRPGVEFPAIRMKRDL